MKRTILLMTAAAALTWTGPVYGSGKASPLKTTPQTVTYSYYPSGSVKTIKIKGQGYGSITSPSFSSYPTGNRDGWVIVKGAKGEQLFTYPRWFGACTLSVQNYCDDHSVSVQVYQDGQLITTLTPSGIPIGSGRKR